MFTITWISEAKLHDDEALSPIPHITVNLSEDGPQRLLLATTSHLIIQLRPARPPPPLRLYQHIRGRIVMAQLTQLCMELK